MKLITATICLAALVGCATDDETNGGAYLSGMRPAKPSLDNPNNSPLPPNPGIDEDMQKEGMLNLPDFGNNVYAETIKPDIPLPAVCDDPCEAVTFIRIPSRNTTDLGEILVVSDGGDRTCKIFLNEDGSLNSTDCNR